MTNIVIAGVGGQGSLLASRILSALYEARGEKVKVSEVHGMSQRGGSVITTVRAGKEVHSPLIPDREGDILIAFEQLEALRYLSQLKPDGTVVTSTQRILPMPVLTGAVPYPEDVLEQIRASGRKLLTLDALALAAEAGSTKTANVVVLGAASSVLGGTKDEWDTALFTAIKPKLFDMNRRAFKLGRDAV